MSDLKDGYYWVKYDDYGRNSDGRSWHICSPGGVDVAKKMFHKIEIGPRILSPDEEDIKADERIGIRRG